MNHALEVMTSSDMTTWQTPEFFLELVRKVAPITLDPCTTVLNPTGAMARLYPEAHNGLTEGWAKYTARFGGLAFVNPPYGRALPLWAAKVAKEAPDTQQVVLVPCRPDTAWYAVLCSAASMRLEWRGRITFVDPRAPAGMQWDRKRQAFVKAQPAAFPVAVFYFAGQGGSTKRFMDAFDGRGRFCHDIRQAA